jgi:hypothetical protein
MKIPRLGMRIFFVTLVIWACSNPPLVVQGTVRSYDPSTKMMVIADEKNPDQELTIALEEADVGAEPQEGDLVRVSYRNQAERHMAIRVMNLTHQEELKKKEH